MTNSPSFSDKCISTPSWLNRRLLDDSSEVSTTRHSRIPIRSIYSSWDETTTAALLAATTGKDDSSIDFAAISTQLGFQESTVRIRFRKAILFAVARELDPFSDEEDNRILHAGRISQQCLPSDISLMWKSLARDLQRKKSTVFTRYQNLDRCKVTQLSTNSSLRSDSPLHPPTLLLDFKAAHQIGNQISLPNTRNSCCFFSANSCRADPYNHRNAWINISTPCARCLWTSHPLDWCQTFVGFCVGHSTELCHTISEACVREMKCSYVAIQDFHDLKK